MSSHTEANISYTFKHNNNLFTLRASTPQEFQSLVDSIAQSGIGANLNAMETSVNNTSALNAQLGAMPVDPAQNPSQGQPATAEPTPDNPWGQTNQQAQGGWAPPQGQQGGNNWGQPPQGQQQGGWGQPQQPSQGGGDWRNDATIQPPHLTPPQTPFGPAKYWGKNKPDGKKSRAWIDPRPYPETKNLPKESKYWVWINDNEL